MNTRAAFYLLALSSGFGATGSAHANDLVVDTFDDTSFHLSRNPDTAYGRTFVVNSPVGAIRSVGLAARDITADTVVTADMSPDAGGKLDFYASGASTRVEFPLGLQISYTSTQEQPRVRYDISGYTAFLFHFTEVTGDGYLVVEIGSGSVYGSQALRTPIIEAGWIAVPFEQVNLGSGGSFDAFYALHFSFLAQSQTFGFTVDEIGLAPVPEPADSALTSGLLSAAWLACRRRARRGLGSLSSAP